MFPGFPTPVESNEVTQARRILLWLEQPVLPVLPKDVIPAYQNARQSIGSRATTTKAKYWPGGPAVRGPRMDAGGTGDEAYGPHRVRSIVKDILVPLIEKDQLPVTQTAALLQQLRGEFADMYRITERAHARRLHG